MTRRNIVGMLLSRFNYNRVTATIVHISVRERLQIIVSVRHPEFQKNLAYCVRPKQADCVVKGDRKYDNYICIFVFVWIPVILPPFTAISER